MDTKDIATALEEWAADVTDATAYPDEPASFLDAFPVVAARIVEDSETRTSTDFIKDGYEQISLQVIVAELSILADPEPAWTSDQALYDIVDALKTSLKADNTLGERVDGASPLYRAEYPGEVETADGTRANLATFRLTIGEKVKT
jgi:non-homologous end joining protein Ku